MSEPSAADHPIHRLPRNALHNLLAMAVPVLVALVTTPFVVHRLGDERFGLYMLTLSVVGFGGLLDLGLSTAALKFVSECLARDDDEELSRVVNSLLLSRLPIALVAVVLGSAAAPAVCRSLLLVSPSLLFDAVFLVRVAAATLGVSMIGGTFVGLLRAAHRFDLASRIGLGFGLSLTAATVALLALGRGLRQIAVAELLLAMLHLAISLAVSRRILTGWRFEPRMSLAWMGRLLHFGGFVALNTLTGIVFVHANRILVGRMLGTAAVTYFAVPWNLSARITQLVYTLTEAITPVASGLATTEQTTILRGLYRRAMRLVTIAAATAALPLITAGPDLLSVWLGAEFGSRGGATLRILAFSAAVQSLSTVPYFILSGLGRPAAANLPTVLGAATNIVLALVLARAYGLPGVALALVGGLALQTCLLILALDRALAMPRSAFTTMVRPALAALTAGALGVLASGFFMPGWMRLIAVSFVTLLAFEGLLIALGCYDRAEIDFARKALFSGPRAATEAKGAG